MSAPADSVNAETPNADPAADEKPWDGELQIVWSRGVRRITIEIDGAETTSIDCAAEPTPTGATNE